MCGLTYLFLGVERKKSYTYSLLVWRSKQEFSSVHRNSLWRPTCVQKPLCRSQVQQPLLCGNHLQWGESAHIRTRPSAWSQGWWIWHRCISRLARIMWNPSWHKKVLPRQLLAQNPGSKSYGHANASIIHSWILSTNSSDGRLVDSSIVPNILGAPICTPIHFNSR